MNLTISGLPALALQIGFVVIFSAPVWLAARLVGADHPTLLRSILSLVLGAVGAIISAAVAGAWALLLAPLAFLLSFKFVLGTSFLGSVLLAIVAIAGYAAMVHFVGAGLSVTGDGVSV
jgi:hypothetical protein